MVFAKFVVLLACCHSAYVRFLIPRSTELDLGSAGANWRRNRFVGLKLLEELNSLSATAL